MISSVLPFCGDGAFALRGGWVAARLLQSYGRLACPLPEAILCETLAHVFTHATWHSDNTKGMFMDRVRWDTLALGVGTVEDAMEDLRLSIAPSDRLKSMWQRYLYFGTRTNQSILWPACIPPISPGDTRIGLSFPARRLALIYCVLL